MATIEQAIERIRSLSPSDQEALLEILEPALALDEAGLELSDAQRAELERRMAAPDDIATDAEVEAFFARLEG